MTEQRHIVPKLSKRVFLVFVKSHHPHYLWDPWNLRDIISIICDLPRWGAFVTSGVCTCYLGESARVTSGDQQMSGLGESFFSSCRVTPFLSFLPAKAFASAGLESYRLGSSYDLNNLVSICCRCGRYCNCCCGQILDNIIACFCWSKRTVLISW